MQSNFNNYKISVSCTLETLYVLTCQMLCKKWYEILFVFRIFKKASFFSEMCGRDKHYLWSNEPFCSPKLKKTSLVVGPYPSNTTTGNAYRERMQSKYCSNIVSNETSFFQLTVWTSEHWPNLCSHLAHL